MSIWDDPEMRVGSDFVRFDDVGDTITGRIVALKAHRWDDGSVSPQLFLDCDGEERTVTAGQVRLKAELAEKRPEEGDTITITLTQIEKRSGGKTLKHFDVAVRRGNDPAPAAAVAEPVTPVAAAANLNPQQQQALKAAGLMPS